MSNIEISPIIFGTMRLADKALTVKECERLFLTAIDNGVNTFHISTEYSSFQLVSSVLASLPANYKSKIKLVAKIACPHFGEREFSHANLNKKVEFLLDAINVQSIEVAQWMWRQNPMDDSIRVPQLVASADELQNSFDQLIKAGKVRCFGCFPYSADFMKKVRELNISDLHINYLNFWEDNLTKGEVGNQAIALRPFYAGQLFKLTPEQNAQLEKVSNLTPVQHALAFPLSNPSIKSVVVGINTLEQLNDAIQALGSFDNIGLFDKYKSIKFEV